MGSEHSRVQVESDDHVVDSSKRPASRGAAMAGRAPRSVQRKLVVGASDDPYEREADRVADAVLSSLRTRAGADVALTGAGAGAGTATRIRRADASHETVVGPEGGDVDGVLAGRIRRGSGRGSPLDPVVRARMEGALGADLGRVRVHSGVESATLNEALGAQAFTYGSDIHLGAGVPDLASADGTRILAHELAHVVQQGGARVQRLVDRAGLIAKAGPPHGNIGLTKRSVEYKTLLDLLDRYHAESQRVWTANVAPDVVRTTLEPILDQLATASWTYVKEQGDDSDRTPHIRDIVNHEIPAERKRLKAVTSGAGFAGLDRAKPLAQVGTGKPATVTAIGVDVSTAQVVDPQEGGVAECHRMNIWLDLDAGTQPASPSNAPGNSIYGVTVEYWENVEIAYNFRTINPLQVAGLKASGEGKTTKRWNDIMAIGLDSPTWGKVGGPIQMSWVAGVAASAGGGLVGKRKVGFQDNPGVTPLPGKHIKRILRFRIVVKDAVKRQEILATQVIECDGTTVPVYMSYVDSLGTKVGKVRAANPDTHVDELTDMARDDARMAAHDVTPAVLGASVPAVARGHVRAFVREILGHTATPFVNKEINEIRAKVLNQPDVSGPYKVLSRRGKKKFGTEDEYYEIAGMNGLPYPQPGMTFFEHAVGGALLVAVTEGSTIRRMYYTTNKSRRLGAQKVRVRSFAEIPIEDVTAYIPTETAYLSMPNAEQTAHDQVAQAEVTEAARVARAKTKMATAFAGGEPATGKYLRSHIGDYDLIEAEYDRTQAPNTLAGMLKTAFDNNVTAGGPTLAVYQRLSKRYPNEKALAILKVSFVDGFLARGAANRPAAEAQFTTLLTNNRAAIGSAPPLVQIVRANAANIPALSTAVMQYLKDKKGKAPTAESDYNTVVPTLGLAGVPPTLGEIVHEFFLAELRAHGKGLAVFAGLVRDYPAFQYRLRPAYRFLFGDAELQTVTERLRSGKAAGDVADPGSAANLAAKNAFLAHGPFTLAGFGSSIEPAAKFDVSYDPKTAVLKVVVKLSFEFSDAGQQPTKVKGKEVGAQYGKSAWTDESKARFIADFRRNVLGVWNPGAPTIRCSKPGWEDIVARPVFEIEEVPKGAGHNNVKAVKAILESGANKAAPKTLKGQGVSAWGKTDTGLKEFDVADKIADPSVHQYLHQAERQGNIAPAYQTDNNRLISRLAQFGRLDFVAGSRTRLTEDARLTILVEELNRLGVPPELAHLHGLEVVGDAAGANAVLAGKRADSIIRRLKALGVKNPMQKVAGASNVDAVIVRAAPADPTIVNTYVRQWSRISAAHEFGHMLGLMDEYYGAKSDAVVKKMISDGLLPPGTRGDHLAANPPADNVGEARGQAATMQLLEATDLATPDFTLQDNAKSTSMMTGGYELWPQHYVTVWEALTKLTAGEISAKYWKLG